MFDRMIVTFCSVLTVAAASAPTARAQTPGVFNRLAGSWSGSGQLMGQDAYFEMTWKLTAASAATLEFANGFVSEAGARTPVLSAMALYRLSATDREAMWLDSRGQRLAIVWEATDTSLISRWTAASETGRTEYVVASGDALLVTDYVNAADGWREFGHARYTRTNAQPGTARSEPENAQAKTRPAPFDRALEPIAWLAGCWRSETASRVMDEQWMAPRGPAMVGMNRTVSGDRLSAYEHLRIEIRNGTPTYVAVPSGQTETAFPMLVASDTLVVFENLQHDFPQRIGYGRLGADSLGVWIEGEADGAVRRVDFPFRRVPCGDAR